jgi:hypothetical protein
MVVEVIYVWLDVDVCVVDERRGLRTACQWPRGTAVLGYFSEQMITRQSGSVSGMRGHDGP